MVKQGRSFSAREPHHCFLNLRDGSFCDVSAVSGLDLRDDGRGVARVDWDRDGDIDFLVSNRSAPRLRFFRNDLPGRNGFIAIRLEGTVGNRDAIGARVNVHRGGEEDVPLAKTLRAGDGFLSQSSKWLHFGLGDHPGPVTVEVRWPDGSRESFPDLGGNAFYRLRETSGRAEVVQVGRATPAKPLSPGPVVLPAPSGSARTVCLSRIPLPAIDSLPLDTGKPLLVTLWASWCAPCVTELKEFAEREAELRATGCDVIAISVDPITPGGDEAAATRILRKLDFPFRRGSASEASIEKLQMVHDLQFDIFTELPLPASFLLDQDGKLAVFYRGRLEVATLLRDLRELGADDAARRNSAELFDGQWFAPPRRLNFFPIGLKLLQRGYDREGIAYYERHKSSFAGHPQFQRMLVFLGDAANRLGDGKRALIAYEEAIGRSAGKDSAALRGAAWVLAADPNSSLRDGHRAVAYAESARKQTGGKDAAVLDALAAAYAEMGDFSAAISNVEAALTLLGDRGEAPRVESVKARRNLYLKKRAFRRAPHDGHLE